MNYRLNTKEKKELIRIFDENSYDVTDLEELTFYLEESGATYIADQEDVVIQWAELMDINCPTEFLDWNRIVDSDNDWEELSNSRYLNIYRIFEDQDVLNELELKKECIKQQ